MYEPANLLIIEDNARNMKRTMELISLFDSDTFAGQRVRLFEVENSRPTRPGEGAGIRSSRRMRFRKRTGGADSFPVDRINTLIAVAPNPGIFAKWRSGSRSWTSR